MGPYTYAIWNVFGYGLFLLDRAYGMGQCENSSDTTRTYWANCSNLIRICKDQKRKDEQRHLSGLLLPSSNIDVGCGSLSW